MKRKIFVIVATAMMIMVVLTACGKAEKSNQPKEENRPKTEVTEKAANSEEEDKEDELVDLTTLSSTMVYSEVFNMVMAPDQYLGRTVKMEGICNIYQDPATGKVYYACIVQDATQCCSQGLEFVLDEDKYSADQYPEAGADITITGQFATYTEGENQYITIKDAQLD